MERRWRDLRFKKRWRAVFLCRPVISNQLWLTDGRGESSSALMQLAIQEEPAYPAGSRGMRGGLAGTQVERERDEKKKRIGGPADAHSLTLHLSPNVC